MNGVVDVLEPLANEYLLIAAGYLFLLASSGVVVRRAYSYIDRSGSELPSDRERRAGTVIGKCENVLILTFVLFEAFTALALVFAVKGIVSRDGEDSSDLYVLIGTLVNFTYSVVIGILLTLGIDVL